MKRIAFALFLVLAVALMAQINVLTSRPILKREFDLDAVFIPATPTTIINQNIWLTSLTLTNTTTTDVQCSIDDLQGSPIPLIPNTVNGAIPSGSVYAFSFDKTKMTGGVRWSCATGGVIAARLAGFIE
jgi:hypothetical protein